MCGISGVVSKSNIHLESFVRMNQIIKHRGPDDEGFTLFNEQEFLVLGSDDTAEATWNSSGNYIPSKKIDSSSFDAKVALGHRRLSILDLSSKGHQPMCDINNRYWITYNGEIYNYIEIRNELIALGYEFYTDSDTEVILRSYEKWGVYCQNKFNGMWAFAIYDVKKQYLFLSRDRFGIKPLYYWFSESGEFYFASEIKQFTVLCNWRAVLNKNRATDYLYKGLTDHSEETLFLGVNILPPGSSFHGMIDTLFSESNKLITSKWYRPKINQLNLNFEKSSEQFLVKFKDSIKLHFRADVPIGSSLSGGLDSSSIVSCINLLFNYNDCTKLHKTFSSCSEDLRFDERKWIEEVVASTNVESTYIYPKGEDVFKMTEKILWHMDEPYQSQSAYLGYHIFEAAKNSKVKVLLNGQGADEYLSGYGQFRMIRLKGMLKKFKIISLLRELSLSKEFFNLIFSFIKQFLPNSFARILSFYSSNLRFIDHLFDKNILGKNKFTLFDSVNIIGEASEHLKTSFRQIFLDPLPRYLRWEDRNSMAHSVEARVPFLDHRLVEFVFSMPVEYLDAPHKSKYILTEAMKGILPESIRNRIDKKGFITPEKRWFINDFSDNFIQLLEENIKYSKGIIKIDEAKKYFKSVQNGNTPFDYTYWRLILFCLWMKIFKVELK